MSLPPSGPEHEPASQLVVRAHGSPHSSIGPWGEPVRADENEERFPLNRYVRILRHRWRIVAGSFLVVTLAVAVGVFITPPVYRAIGTIEIRKQATEVVPVEALFQFERISEQYLQTEYGTLRSRALLERMLGVPGLERQLQAAFLDDSEPAPGGDATSVVRLAEEVHERVIIDPVLGSRIVRVGFDSPDPVLSATVVNALVSNYIDMRREAAADALVRLGDQADSVRTQLLAAERQLQEYVRANDLGPVVIAGSGGETVPQERLRRLQQELTEADAEAYRAAALSNTARERTSTAESELLKNLRVRMAELEGEYARSLPTFTDSFPRVRQLRSELARLDSLVAVEEQRVSGAMTGQHEAALHRRNLLRVAVDEQRAIVEGLAADLAEYDRRRRDVESLKELYSVLQQKGKEASLSAALSTMDIAVLDAAQPPVRALRPRPARDLGLAALTGLLLGIGLAFVREYTDSTVRSPEELVGVGRVPLLGSIPAAASSRWQPLSRGTVAGVTGNGDGWKRIDADASPESPIAEAFRYLRTSVLFDGGGELPRTLLVTSSVPAEGKTTVSTNFAMSLTRLGRRVLLVDADMRRPTVQRVFDLPARPGLAEYLQGSASFRRVRHRNVRPGLDVILAGTGGESPSDLLTGEGLNRLLSQETGDYDIVIFDAPAVQINAPDARILAHAVEGVLLVVRSGSTSRELVRRSIAQTPNLVGVVLNRIDPKRLPEYYSDYGRRPDDAVADGGQNGTGRRGGSPQKPDDAGSTAVVS